jgi:hypothetical protein
VEPSPNKSIFGNEYIIKNILNGDQLFHYNATEKSQNRKRKRHNNQTFIDQEGNKNLNNASRQECDTKYQNQEDKQNYSENKKEKMDNVQYFCTNSSNKKYENFINLNKNENTKNEKRSHNTTLLQENNDEQKNEKKNMINNIKNKMQRK